MEILHFVTFCQSNIEACPELVGRLLKNPPAVAVTEPYEFEADIVAKYDEKTRGIC